MKNLNYGIVTYKVYSKSFNIRQEAIDYCTNNRLPQLMIEKFVNNNKVNN